MNNCDWIDAQIELPPEDGNYEVTNHPDSPYSEGVIYYDGIGFIHLGIYRPVLFWRHYTFLQKKYGKVVK